MTYKELKKRGLKLSEDTIIINDVYIGTYEYYSLGEDIYIHRTHKINIFVEKYGNKLHVETATEYHYNSKNEG